ncbi:MAG: DUF4395 domain-containing protein [Bacteroidota bacterium]|nr:MAG: DUF4395 domain-containing protein [Bacteroidota bacterium]
MKNKLKFGETVEGYSIPVLNEREIRAAAGILFLFTFLSLMLIVLKGNFILIKYVITAFLADFLIRVFISPKYAPTLVLGRLIVRRQNPEYVGAAQKKFAWIIGIILAATMFILMVVVNSYSAISGIICLFCLIFLFFESAFGICLGCLFYGWFYKEKAQYCPGEICDVKARQDIQKISFLQIGMLLSYLVFILIIALTFNEILSITPVELWSKFQ